MDRSIAQGGGPASPRRFIWSLTTSGTVHGTVLGIVGLFGGWWVAADAAERTNPAAQAVTVPLVLLSRVDFDEAREAEPEVTQIEPELEDSELIETPLGEAPVAPPVEPEMRNPLAHAPLVTRELLWRIEQEAPRPEPTPVSDPVTVEVEIALAAEQTIVEASLLEAPAPRYPRLSVRGGEEGTVICRLFVSAQGSVTRVEIVESSGYRRLDQAALAALREWRFAPQQEDGHPVATTIRHPVTFVLETD